MRLASDGYDLALFDIPAQNFKLGELMSAIPARYGVKVISVMGSVSVEKDVEALLKETVDKLGGLDVVSDSLGSMSG